MKIKLAIFSPNQNAYSETFIQAHKGLPFSIRFYYGGFIPEYLEGQSIMALSLGKRLQKKFKKDFTQREKNLLFSLKSQKVDVVLAEYGLTAADSLDVIKHLGLPLIVHFHGYDITNREILDAYKEKYLEVFDYADAVVGVSQRMCEDLVNAGCHPGKITLNPYGPSDAFLDVHPEYKSNHFLAIGRFVEKKAPHLLLFAFSKVVQQIPGAHLTMIGDGPLLPVCRDLIAHLNLNDNVSLIGVQSPAEIRSHMKESIAFVQHSVTADNGDSEGTPVAVLEAQAAALPVISTLHAGIPDVVLHGETGLLCDERDVQAMAENMLRILSEPELAQKLGISGRHRVRKHFSMEKHLSSLATVIMDALEAKSRRYAGEAI